MKIILEPNSEGDREIVPFHVRVDIETATINAGSTFYIPVEVHHQGLEKTFSVDLCGFQISCKRPEELPARISGFLPRLISIARFPTYMFIARRANGIYPVYTQGNEVFATTPGGPVFRHVELAKVREYLTDYLHAAGVLGEKGLSDKLHARGVDTKTLGLRRPVFYLKKRVPGEVDFWAPVFEAGDGKHIYAFAASERRDVPIIAGVEVLFLRQTVANALKHDGRLSNNFDLRPDRLFPEYWERLKNTLKENESIEVGGIELPVYENGNALIAVEIRPEEERYGLFLGKDLEDLRARIKVDFERRGVMVSS